MPKLVVVESAAKAKTIEKFLGRGYTVRACLGHVRDLPTSKLGVDVQNDFRPQYVIPKERKEVVKRLKGEVRDAQAVLLATDPDREGEAIAWHLVSALELNPDNVLRIEFFEITRGAVEAAIKKPRHIDMKRVDAQQARRILDRLIGYPVSTFLGRKVRRGLSAGRVQSVAVRMVVDREREIRDFVPVEYWSLEAELAKRQVPVEKGRFVAALVEREGKKLELKTGLEADTVQTDLQGASWTVAAVKEREQQRNPAPPFTTSTLQQEASRKLNFTAKRTMAVAQQLYEGVDIGAKETSGLITYMRTDSVNVAETARAEAREYIAERLGKELLPPSARLYKTRSRLAQEAHEAIRPTSVFHEPAAIKRHLTSDQFRLYELIWKRFLASQMASAVFDVTTVDVDAQANARPRYRFRATGSRLKFRGFLTLYLEGRDDEEVRDEDRQPLPVLTVGEVVDLIRLKPEQHFTQPPPRYTEATLVKALEERGIGRPSTYAPILSTIQDRGYVERDGKKLKPTELGEQVNDLLVKQFGTFLNLDFTATLEEKLDDIAQKELPWVPVVRDFYLPLNEDLKRAEVEVERIKPAEIPTDEVCSEGHPMVIKEGRFGKFMACSRYPEHKETRPVPEDLPPDAPEERCSHGVQMQLRTGRFGPYYASTHECGETKAYAARTGVACPSCGADLVEKRSRKGRVFFGCNTWPKCEWVSWYRPIPEPCAQCGGIQVEIGRDRRRCLKHEGEPARPAARSGEGEEADGRPATRTSTRRDGAAKGRRGGTAPAGVTKVVRAKRATSAAATKAAATKNGRAGARKRATRTAESVR